MLRTGTCMKLNLFCLVPIFQMLCDCSQKPVHCIKLPKSSVLIIPGSKASWNLFEQRFLENQHACSISVIHQPIAK